MKALPLFTLFTLVLACQPAPTPSGSLSADRAEVTASASAGTASDASLTLSAGAKAVRISALAVAPDGAWSLVTAAPVDVPAGGSAQVALQFAPASGGTHDATLTVTHDGAGSPLQIALHGTAVGFVSADPPALALKTMVAVPTSASVKVSNTTGASVELTAFAVSPAGPWTTSASAAITVPNLATATVPVSYLPTADGPHDATLSIAHSAPGSPLTVALVGITTGKTCGAPFELSLGQQGEITLVAQNPAAAGADLAWPEGNRCQNIDEQLGGGLGQEPYAGGDVFYKLGLGGAGWVEVIANEDGLDLGLFAYSAAPAACPANWIMECLAATDRDKAEVVDLPERIAIDGCGTTLPLPAELMVVAARKGSPCGADGGADGGTDGGADADGGVDGGSDGAAADGGAEACADAGTGTVADAGTYDILFRRFDCNVFTARPAELRLETRVGTPATGEITLVNTGLEPVTVTGLAFDPAIAWRATPFIPFIVGARMVSILPVTFDPPGAGTFDASLTVTRAGGAPLTVALKGTSLASVFADPRRAFVTTLPNETATATFTIHNSLAASVDLTGFTFADASGPPQTTGPWSAGAAPMTVPAGGTSTLTATFAPTRGGLWKATLQAAHSGAGSPLRVHLTGAAGPHLTAGTPVQGTVPMSGTDVYLLDAVAGSTYIVAPRTASGDDWAQVGLYVYDDEDGVWEGALGQLPLSFTARKTVTHVVTVYEPGYSALDYQLTVSEVPREHEPNGTAAQATASANTYPAGDLVQGAIDPADDVDVFAFAATGGRVYTMKTLHDPATRECTAGWVMTLYGTDGTTQLAEDAGGANRCTFLRWSPPADGTYFIRVRSVAGAIPRYFLSATSVPPPASEAEPNGAPEQANAMESVALLGEGMARGTIDPSGDLDLFRFSATPGLAYVIEALARCDPAARLTLYDSDGTTVLGSDSGGVGHCPKFAWQRPNSDFPDPVDSFVGVSGQSGATLSYTLLVWQGYLYGHWETEPNDTGPSDAIAPGERWSGSIGPGTDRDLFGLSGPAGTALTFETFGFGGPGTCGFDTKLEVLGPDGTTLLASDDDGGEGSCSLLQWTVPDAQGYSLAVSSADGEPIPLYVLEVR